MGPKNLIFAIVLGSAIAAGIFVAMKMNEAAELRAAFVIPIPDSIPNFSLLDQTGQHVNADIFRGQWDLVFFGFTNCPDVCPMTLQILANVRRELMDAGGEALPRIVLVSVDPERDTPEILGQYVAYFGEGSLGLTGEIEGIRTLTAALGIYFEKAPTSDTDYGVDHSAAVLVINPKGEFSALFSAPHTVANYVHDLPIIMGTN